MNRILADFPELECTLGLLTSDRRRKPLAQAYAELTGLPHQPASPGGAGSRRRPGGPFFETWMAAARDGERLAITTTSHAADESLLAARGITELRTP